MSINITKSNTNTTSANTNNSNVNLPPRDEKGRFVTPKTSEAKAKTSLHPVSRSRIEETAPYVNNFIEFNAIVRQKMDEIANVYYLKREEQSFYIFRTTADTYFGFELCCGELEELLDNTKAFSIVSNPLNFWDEVQKA